MTWGWVDQRGAGDCGFSTLAAAKRDAAKWGFGERIVYAEDGRDFPRQQDYYALDGNHWKYQEVPDGE